MKVAIIGGGAAGFFAAIQVKENFPTSSVTIFEKSKKVLAKVKISGGGRCNVTNGTTSIKELSSAYPRGGKQLKKAFQIFNTKHCMEWFEERGVPLTIQEDQCVFPVSQSSQSIIDCFQKEVKRLNIQVKTSTAVQKIESLHNNQLKLYFKDQNILTFDKVIVATGGSPKRTGLEWLEALGHQIINPVPSLFTFNMPNESITQLMGVVVEKTRTSIQGTKLQGDGPLLITHWGMSGPAILKLSAFGARILNDCNYEFNVQINWVNEVVFDKVVHELRSIVRSQSKKMLSNYRPYLLPDRLWKFLLNRSQLAPEKRWGELGKTGINKLASILCNDVYAVKGKTTFKEEFVTAGGVSLESINFKTMQSRVCKNLYFAGEVMDVDGITGGYNFQAAWTTAFIAGQLK